MKTNTDFLKLQSDDWMKEFKRIAESLCFEHNLCANEHKFAIVDIEFYYYSKGDHPDPFVYSTPSKRNQKKGEWFFHYSGIDITIGEGETRGGILIRAIQDLNTSEYIIGTLKSMYAILNCFPSIESGNGLILRLERITGPKIRELTKGVRIGLEKDKKGIDAEKYRNEKYRFTADYYTIAEKIRTNELKVASQMKKNYGVI